MRRVIIIGGGVAGLSAGIYAQQNGYNSEIYEKNPMLGGECTGWSRQGYHVDNCIHWLTGCRKEDDLYKIWENLGVLGENIKLIHDPYMYKMEMEGKELHFWRDLEKSRREFLEVAPEDEEEINKFFDSVKMAECIRIPFEKSQADMNVLDFMKFGMSMKDMGQVMKEYGQESVSELSNRFRSPYIKNMMSKYYHHTYLAYTLITSYAFYTSGMGAIPEGGSVGIINRMVDRYLELGGKVFTSMPAEKINIKNNRAESVLFKNGESVKGDIVICATDTAVTFNSLLDEKYMDKKLRKLYTETDGYKITSIFNVAFGIIGDEKYNIEGATIFPCEKYMVAKENLDFIGVRMYDYDETVFAKDKRVIQCSILQDEEDYEYWKELYKDREKYNETKQEIANEVEKRIVEKYPELKGRLVLLSTYSPMTFTKWCGAYKGAYMSFFQQKGYKSVNVKNTIKDVKNVVLAGQWLTMNGGLPMAALSGKFAAEKLKKIK